MSISAFYNKTVSTQRLTVVASSNKEIFSTNEAAISCAIHPLSPKEALSSGGAFFNTFKMFCAVSEDIEDKDRVIDGSDTYTVQSVAIFDDVVGNTHKEIVLTKGE